MDDESHPNHNQHLEGDPLSGNSFTYAQQFRSHPHLNSTPHPQSQPLQRRPRGFAAANAAPAPPVSTPCSAGGGITAVGAEKGRREREKEKERTKLRERHRRAITSRMLAGLRQYGNFQLPARADMNDVLAALARQAGWVVETDGTTYRDFAPPSSPPAKMTTYLVRSAETPISTSSFKNRSTKASFDRQASAGQINQSLSPASLDSIVVTDCSTKSNKYTSSSANSFGSPDCLEADEFIQDVPSFQYHSDFLGTPSVPVYIMLSRGIINNYCQLVDPEGVREELKHLKLLHVDGVAVECWWGIVEGWDPQKYSWAGYRELFMVLREVQLNVQVVMSFYALGGIDSSDLFISLPEWVLDIGKDNQDIFFTDREGQRNTNCLSWGIDKERVLRGRTGLEVYYDLMRSFRMEFDDLLAEGLITTVDIGLGASGELKFPSFSEIMGWRYPGIGEFQCYDRYLQQKLQKAAKLRGHPYWARGPDNAGHYNSRTHETGFFCDQGDYDSCYGRFFLRWYAQTLISHADDVLSWARLAFEDTQISVKIPAIYWWYKTASHAAELTAGYYNSANRDGYLPILNVLQKHSVVAKLTTPTFHVNSQEYSEGSSADPEGLRWQFMNTAWDMGITIAGQIEGPCNREEQRRVVEASKPRNDPDQRHFSFFVYQPPCSPVQRNYDLADLSDFVKSMHGKSG